MSPAYPIFDPEPPRQSRVAEPQFNLSDFMRKHFFPSTSPVRPVLPSTVVILQKVAATTELLCQAILSHDRYLQDLGSATSTKELESLLRHLGYSERDYSLSIAQLLADQIMEERLKSVSITPAPKQPESCTETTSPTLSCLADPTGYPAGLNGEELATMSEPPAPRVPRPKVEVEKELYGDVDMPADANPGLETYEPGGEREVDDEPPDTPDLSWMYHGDTKKDMPF